MDLIDFRWLQLVVAPLPSHQIPGGYDAEDDERKGAAPIDQRVAEQEVFDHVILPAAHAQANMEDGPLPKMRRKIVLLVWVWNKRVVGGHHGHVEVHKITEKGRLVGAGIPCRHYSSRSAGLHHTNQGGSTFFIPVGLHVPVCVDVSGRVLFDTCHFNLLEAPLREIDITGPKIATKNGMLQTEWRRQGPNLRSISGCCVVHYFHGPMILVVAYGGIAIGWYFIVRLGNRSRYHVRMEVAARLRMDQAYDILVPDEPERFFRFIFCGIPARIEEPIVVRIFVMITCHLLLLRPFWIGLDVRMEQTTTVAHIFQGGPRTDGNLQWAILSHFGSFQVCLEQRAHLRISGTGIFQHQKVYVKRKHVDEQWKHNEPHDSRHDMWSKLDLHQVSELSKPRTDHPTTGNSRSPNLFHRSSAV